MVEVPLVGFPVMFAAFAFFGVILSILFRKVITSIFDPLIFFMVWAASVLAAGVCLFFLKPDPMFFVHFVLSMVLLVLLLAWSLKRVVRIADVTHPKALAQRPQITRLDWVVFTALTLVNLASLLVIFVTVSRAGLESFFAARFFLMEDFKSPLIKIVSLVVRPMLFAQAFRMSYFLPSGFRKRMILLVITFFALSIFVLGNRSVILFLATLYGGTIVLYRRDRKPPAWASNYLLFGIFVGTAVTFLTIATTGYFGLDFLSALNIAVNRFLLAADCLFMWVEKDLQYVIQQSPLELLNFIFGQFLGTLQKNFGWQLYEAYIGKTTIAAYGPNFIFPFQVYVATWAAPLWFGLTIVAGVTMRCLKPVHNVTDCCRIVAVSYAFQHFQDPEYAAFLFGFLLVFWGAMVFARHLLIGVCRGNTPSAEACRLLPDKGILTTPHICTK